MTLDNAPEPGDFTRDEMVIDSDLLFTREIFLMTLGRLVRLYWGPADAVRAVEVLLRVSGGEPLYVGDYDPPRYGLFGITTAAARLQPSEGYLLWNPIRNTAWAAKLQKSYGWEWWANSLPENRARAQAVNAR